jgi:hypothetical protein
MKQFKMLLLASMVMLFTACGGGSSSSATTSDSTPYTPSTNDETGVMSLSISDAKPRLPEEPIAVYITVTGIEFNYDGKWTDVNDFEFENDALDKNEFKSQTFNLLELQNGNSLHLGDIVLPVGYYTEIRFKLDAPEKNGKVKSNPGCYIVFPANDEHATVWSEPLFVPSGGQSGYKGKGEFYITANAKIEIMADFNVEKSIVVTGNEKYLLKPVIRLVVTELSGTIKGTVVDIEKYPEEDNDLTVYAYAHDAAIEIIDEVMGDSEGILFPNAVTSGDVNMTDGNFTLPFLGEGNYTLVTVNTDVVGVGIIDVEEDVEVLKGEVTRVDVNTSDYTPL